MVESCNRVAYITIFIILVIFVIILMVCYFKQIGEEPFNNNHLMKRNTVPPEISMTEPLDTPWVMRSYNDIDE